MVCGPEGQKLLVHELCCCPSFDSVVVFAVTIMLSAVVHSWYNAMDLCQKNNNKQM